MPIHLKFLSLACVLMLQAGCASHAVTASGQPDEPAMSRQAMSPASGSLETRILHQTSPFPKYMLIISIYPDRLQLTDAQNKAFADWRHEHMGQWSSIYAEVLAADKATIAASYRYQQDSLALLPDFRASLDKRYRLAEMTANCTNNVRKLLSEEQWNELIRIYQSMLDE